MNNYKKIEVYKRLVKHKKAKRDIKRRQRVQ